MDEKDILIEKMETKICQLTRVVFHLNNKYLDSQATIDSIVITYDKEIDYETFTARVKIYKDQKKAEKAEDKNKIIDIKRIKTYVEDNLYEVIIVAIFIILLIITILLTIKSVKKSRRLE